METDVSSGYVRVSKRMFPRPILCPILPPMTRQALPPMTDDRQPEPFGFGFGTGRFEPFTRAHMFGFGPHGAATND